MKFLAGILIQLSNNTIPLSYILIIIGCFLSIIQGIGKYKKLKNDIIIQEISPLVEDIKNKNLGEDEELKLLNKLYKKHNFSVIIPSIFSIISIILYIIMLTIVFYGKNFDLTLYNGPINFFLIENIFVRNTLIFIPIVILIIRIFSTYVFIPKKLINIKEILINILLFIITTFIFTNILSSTYAIFLLGFYIGELIYKIPFNHLKRKVLLK